MLKIELFLFEKEPLKLLQKPTRIRLQNTPDIRSQNGPQNTEIQPNEELKTHETTLNPC